MFDIGSQKKVASFHLHDVTYASVEVVTPSHLGGDVFIRKYITWPLAMGSTSHEGCPVPFTLCDICN